MKKDINIEPVALPERKDEIAKLGPLYSRPMQGEPKLRDGELIVMANKAAPHPTRDNDMFYIAMGRLVEEHYTHADPGEVERIKWLEEMLESNNRQYESGLREQKALRTQLTEVYALLEEAYRDGWNDGQEAIEQRYQNTPRSSTEGWERFKADNSPERKT